MATTTSTLMPNHFQGLTTEDAARWWEDVEHWCAFRKLREEERVGLVPLLLKEGARHWYNALPVGGKDTFHHLKESFLSHFKRGDEVRWRDMAEVWGTVQVQGQSVEEYIVKIQEKAIRANLSEEQTRFSIINGLRKNIRQSVLQHEITSINDIKRRALMAEASVEENLTTDVQEVIKRLEKKIEDY